MTWPDQLPLETILFERDGRSIAAIVPTIPDDAPPRLKEGLVRRRSIYTTGRCPCGARWSPPAYLPSGVHPPGSVEHSDHCPAIDKRMRREVRRWLERTP